MEDRGVGWLSTCILCFASCLCWLGRYSAFDAWLALACRVTYTVGMIACSTR